MTEIICAGCDKPVTTKTEVEYSQEYSEFYCNFDCAVEALIDRARCAPLDLKDKKQVNETDAVIKRGKLHWNQDV